MASNQTSNYGLNQWQAQDKVLREEFNQDNAKIDAALGAIRAEAGAGVAQVAATVPQIAAGTYTGSGSASQFVSLPFAPKAVFVCSLDGRTYVNQASGYVYGGLALMGSPAVNHYLPRLDDPYVDYPAVELLGSGFRVYETKISDYAAVRCNTANLTYHYLAIRY